MKVTNKAILIALLSLTGINAQTSNYSKAIETINKAPKLIKDVAASAPQTFNFNSQFDQTRSSVSYTGQSFRQVLINDIYVAMASSKIGSFQGTRQNAVLWLDSYLSYDEQNRSLPQTINADSFFSLRAKKLDGSSAEVDEGFFYSDIQSPGKNLVSKLAGVDNALRREKVIGVTGDMTPKELLISWFNEFSMQAFDKNLVFTVPNGNLAPQVVTKAATMVDGRDLAQLTQKFLHGAVSYSQTARDYFSTDLGATKGLNADNTKPAKQGKFYTAMEHHFDEGFGYFGAARDYLSYSDEQIRKKVSYDSDLNGFISIKSEMNLGASTLAGRIDLTAIEQNTDFSNEAMSSMLKGRHLITMKPEDYKKYAVAYSVVALGAWEKSLAGIVIHYINKTLKSYNNYGTQKYLFTNFAKFWSEMKGYGFAFQFNPNGIMTDKDFDQMHALMGEKPVVPHSEVQKVNQYKNQLLKARNILQTTYDFSDENVKNW